MNDTEAGILYVLLLNYLLNSPQIDPHGKMLEKNRENNYIVDMY